MTFTFTPATREAAKARIGLQGPAGSGKTKSALRIAEGLAKGGSIGVIDTERGSALTYAPVPGKPELGGHEFGHMPMDTHDPRHLIQAIAAARAASISVLIVDSWSHFWNGRGGLLTIVEEAGRKPGAGGSFGGWREGNPIEQDMLDALLNYPGHVIATMRTKGDYVIEGKKVTKVGVRAVQREGAEYELGLILDMVEGTGSVTKTRYEPLEGLTIHHPGEDLAEIILEQLGQGVDPIEVLMTDLTAPGLTYEGALALHARAKSRGLLETGQLHPKTGAPSTIGALIAEYGSALRPQPAAPVAAPTPAEAEQAPAAAFAQGTASTGVVTAPQMRMMHACFAKVGLGAKDQRDERLRATGLIVGRQVGTANELTFDEAATLLDTLSAYGDFDNPADEFAAMVQGLEDEFAKQPAHA